MEKELQNHLKIAKDDSAGTRLSILNTYAEKVVDKLKKGEVYLEDLHRCNIHIIERVKDKLGHARTGESPGFTQGQIGDIKEILSSSIQIKKLKGELDEVRKELPGGIYQNLLKPAYQKLEEMRKTVQSGQKLEPNQFEEVKQFIENVRTIHEAVLLKDELRGVSTSEPRYENLSNLIRSALNREVDLFSNNLKKGLDVIRSLDNTRNLMGSVPKEITVRKNAVGTALKQFLKDQWGADIQGDSIKIDKNWKKELDWAGNVKLSYKGVEVVTCKDSVFTLSKGVLTWKMNKIVKELKDQLQNMGHQGSTKHLLKPAYEKLEAIRKNINKVESDDFNEAIDNFNEERDKVKKFIENVQTVIPDAIQFRNEIHNQKSFEEIDLQLEKFISGKCDLFSDNLGQELEDLHGEYDKVCKQIQADNQKKINQSPSTFWLDDDLKEFFEQNKLPNLYKSEDGRFYCFTQAPDWNKKVDKDGNVKLFYGKIEVGKFEGHTLKSTHKP